MVACNGNLSFLKIIIISKSEGKRTYFFHKEAKSSETTKVTINYFLSHYGFLSMKLY
jgi:hypothetical protein